MAYVFKTDIAHKSNYGGWRALSVIDYIVIHYTANDGDTDENNGNYFNGANRKASAHLFVDDDSVTQSVPYNYVAWHCGGGLQGSGGHSFYKKCTNTNSIGIEICDDVRNGTIYPSAKTIENVIALTKSLMKQFNIPASRVIRHFDVTGKLCPAYWCGTTAKNNKWRSEFWNKLSNTSSGAISSVENPEAKGFLMKGDKGTAVKELQTMLIAVGYDLVADGSFWTLTENAVKDYQKKHGLTIDGYYGPKTKAHLTKKYNSFKPYLVKITCTTLNVRKGAGTSYKVATQVKKNQVYTIVEEKNGWGKLKSGVGWICLQYTKKC